MFRKRDWVGVAGLLMLICGAFLFLNHGSGILPVWSAWLLGPLLWYGGFLTTCLWFLTRMFLGEKKVEQKKAAEKVVEQRRASNFLEHDTDLVPHAMHSKMPVVCVGVVALALMIPAVSAYASADDAAALFKSKCAMCHGPNADGKTAMGAKMNIRDFHSPEVQKQTDAEITATITKGKNKMPAYEGKLTPEQIKELTEYVRSMGKK